MIVIIARWSSLKGNYNLSAVYEPILSSFTGKDWIYILNPSLLLMMREMLYIWCLKVAAGQLEAARFLLTICSRCWNQNHCRYPCFVSHNITGAGAEPGTLVWERLPLVGSCHELHGDEDHHRDAGVGLWSWWYISQGEVYAVKKKENIIGALWFRQGWSSSLTSSSLLSSSSWTYCNHDITKMDHLM